MAPLGWPLTPVKDKKIPGSNNKLKTSKSVISRMENHATDIRLSTLEKFAKAVGRDIRVALV